MAKKTLLFVCFVMSLLNGSAQRVCLKCLHGQWQLIKVKEDSLAPADFKAFYSLRFFTNSYLQKTYTRPLEKGEGSGLVQDTVREYYRVKFMKRNSEFLLLKMDDVGQNAYQIDEYTDSTLTLRVYNVYDDHRNEKSYFFRKTDTLGTAFDRVSNDSIPYLVNSFDSTKTMRANPRDGNYCVRFSESKGDTLLHYEVYGHLMQVSDSFLTFRPDKEQISVERKDHSRSEITTTYRDRSIIKTYRLRDVSLSYTIEKNKFLNNLSGFLMIYGYIHALVIAPAVSVNLSEMSVNSQRYFTNAAVGLGGIVTGALLSLLPDSKTYEVSPLKVSTDKKFWYFKKFPAKL